MPGLVIPTRVFTLFASELVLLLACYLAAAFADPDIIDATIFLNYDSGALRIAIVVGFVILGLFFGNLYSEVRIRDRLALFRSLCVIFGFTFIGQGLIGYLDRDWIIPRKMMLGGSVLGLGAVFGWRILFDRAARTAKAAGKILFLGMSPTTARIAGHFASHPELGLAAVGYLDSGSPVAPSGVSCLGTMDNLDDVMDRATPDSIVIGNRNDIQPWWADEFLALRFGGIRVQEAGTLYERIFDRKCVSEIWPSKAIFTDESAPGVVDAGLQPIYSWAIAFLTALVTLPVSLPVALMIRLGSAGPVLTKETRTGQHGRPFDAYRFRCVREDGSYTPIGRFLRRHGLVWLPQIINVLRGEMAIVGPRPERPAFARRMAELIPFYDQRHRVKPGVTGWARIHRRKGEPQDSLSDFEYDLYYLENLSPSLDFYILLLSLRAADEVDENAESLA